MVSVLIALVVGLTGALAGLLPNVLVSQRKRLLHYVKEENEVLGLVKDAQAVENLSRALRRTTQEYARLTHTSSLERARLRLSRFAPFLVAMGLNGVLLAGLSKTIGESAADEKALGIMGAALVLVGFVPAILLLLAYLELVREDSRDRRKLTERRMIQRMVRAQEQVREMNEQRRQMIEAGASQEDLADLEIAIEDLRAVVVRARERLEPKPLFASLGRKRREGAKSKVLFPSLAEKRREGAEPKPKPSPGQL